jgi:hypothetical protein
MHCALTPEWVLYIVQATPWNHWRQCTASMREIQTNNCLRPRPPVGTTIYLPATKVAVDGTGENASASSEGGGSLQRPECGYFDQASCEGRLCKSPWWWRVGL